MPFFRLCSKAIRACSASWISSPPISSPRSRIPTLIEVFSMYRAPVRELRFVLDELLAVQELSASPELSEYSPQLGESVLEEAGRFASTVLDPLNQTGDREGAR